VRKRLKRVGEILHPSPIAPNIIIAKVTEYLEPGTIVYDENLEKIGVIIEIFGSVNAPYARIKVEDGKNDRKKFMNKQLFIITGEKARVSWRKMPGYRSSKKKRPKKPRGEANVQESGRNK